MGESAQASEQALSALERALRDALASAGPEQVLQTLTSALTGKPGTTGDGTPPVDAQAASQPVELDPERFHGRVQKVSVSMPEELSLAIRERTGPGGFSRYIAEAAEDRLKNEQLGEYLDELDRTHGPVPQEILDWAERLWQELEE
jgi:hypothetical protein